MNLASLHRKLIAAARSTPLDARVPYSFEKRIMAHLRAAPPVDAWALWSRALWRAAAPCVGIMLVLGAWSFFAPAAQAPSVDLSQQFENTVLAAADQDQFADTTW